MSLIVPSVTEIGDQYCCLTTDTLVKNSCALMLSWLLWLYTQHSLLVPNVFVMDIKMTSLGMQIFFPL